MRPYASESFASDLMRAAILSGPALAPIWCEMLPRWHSALDVFPSSIGPYRFSVFRLRMTSMKFCMWRSSPLNSFTVFPLLSTAFAEKYCVVIRLPPSQSMTLPMSTPR